MPSSERRRDVESVLGMIVRATATYLFLLMLIRIGGKRTIHEGTPFDFVVALVLGDFPDDVIWGEVPVAQGLVAMGTVMTIHLCVVYASYRSRPFDRMVGSVPTRVLSGGRILPGGLRAARMNTGDLDVQLRHHGIEDRGDVKLGFVEATGEVSALRTERARAARRGDLGAPRAA
jgi:uncharacterized membrane protein YcaP (DUF421 family)